jgi:hypothetical protein
MGTKTLTKIEFSIALSLSICAVLVLIKAFIIASPLKALNIVFFIIISALSIACSLSLFKEIRGI